MSYGKFLDESGDLNKWRKKNNLPDQHYEKTFADLRDIWIKDKRYSELIAFIHENWDSGQWDDFFEPLESHLLENNIKNEYKIFWKGLIRNRLMSLWDLLKHIDKDSILNVEPTTDIGLFKRLSKKLFTNNKLSPIEKIAIDKQRETLDGLESFLQGLKRLKEFDEISKIEKLIENVKNLEKPKPKPTSDKRVIDESVFWELIDNNRQKSEDKGDFLELLTSQLEEFKPTEIRRFEKIFQTKFQELNHWDLWALAYIVRRGCDDDAFDYFKAWVISKGKDAFEVIKELKVPDLKRFFDEDPQFEDILYLAENVYENKTGEIMSPIRVKRQSLIGEKWDEDKLCIKFPKLCELFDYKNNCH
ncbi:hypothetical protein TRIP_D430022 [uncultured Paludibacter sp.]|nr:hypothetical protein TRIP_D430022 [uncultured Paludibacter sp.]